eukprot:109681_1
MTVQNRNAVFLMGGFGIGITIHKMVIRFVWLNGLAINRQWVPQQLVMFHGICLFECTDRRSEYLNILKIEFGVALLVVFIGKNMICLFRLFGQFACHPFILWLVSLNFTVFCNTDYHTKQMALCFAYAYLKCHKLMQQLLTTLWQIFIMLLR